MPFGLSNILSVFQYFMNEIFSNLLNISIAIYLNDILIYFDNFVDHKKHIKEILSRL